MPLFQPSVLKKYINDLDRQKLAEAWKRFQIHFHGAAKQENIRSAKEEQYQEGFLRELFVDVLGYTLNPQPGYNLTTEYKNEKDSRKADGAILSIGVNNEKAVRAVIELKGTDTTDLGKIETQAFSYLHNHKGCTYVITSNFEKLRFYITDATDHEEFHLFDLDEERFALLYVCLHAENLLIDLPLTIKQLSLQQEDAVTKKLYADYSRFKTELYKDITSHNQQYDKLELFKKTQKLLDRLLFILFAEDRLLLPPNFMIKIVEEHKQVQKLRMQQSLYERFRIYFNDLKEGNTDQDIFAYNGGLFEPDEVLDQLQISDEVLMKGVLGLSQYDYNTEVDVNILGHIFEHSLNQLEELQASLENTVVEKSKTRRKKEGVFYTPRYITKYIVENTIGSLCTEKKAEMQIAEEEYSEVVKKKDKRVLLQKLDDYRAWLLSLKICDPACGSGAFLNAALEFLIEEHSYIDELTNKLMGSGLGFRWTPNDILEHNLYGVDINEEAIEIAKLSLWLRTAEKGRKLSDLSDNIKCGNSLIDDPAVAGDKAFNWTSEFKEVFDKGGFDVVIGNPPYATKIFDESILIWYKSYYTAAEYQVDLYILFLEKGTGLLSDNGIMGFITPNSWLKNLRMSEIRKFLLKNLYFINITPNIPNVFEDANVDSLIFIAIKGEVVGDTIINVVHRGVFFPKHIVNQKDWLNNNNNVFTVEATSVFSGILSKMNSASKPLSDFFEITRGVNPYDSSRGQSKDVIRNKVYHSNYRKDPTFVPELRGKHIGRYYHEWDGLHYISYGKWLAAPREEKFFKGERFIFRQVLGEKLICTVIKDDIIIDQSIFIAIPIIPSSIDVKYVLSLVASKLGAIYFKYTSNEFDELFPKIKLEEFKKLPVKVIELKYQQPFIIKADMMLSLNKELNNLKKSMLQLLHAKFSNFNITKKLSIWIKLSFKEFIQELEKQKIKLSLVEQNEWLEYFEAEKNKANELQEVIDRTDKEIDAMVYELYELTEEEIRIVEAS